MNPKRKKNEKKFASWDELSDGGRRYFFEVRGQYGFKARYVKEVDKSEITTKFYQEIYDNKGQLIEIHEKYPVDIGHVKVGGNNT
ncbi:hypothetical protein MHK_006858 [Candidatus Magnetomorum sp. HK-1]|nr:hypothetical protein MHK_006858 [Candidatus Magnetomorum sp. HK-1]